MCPEYSDFKETELKRLTDEYDLKKEGLIKAEKRRKEASIFGVAIIASLLIYPGFIIIIFLVNNFGVIGNFIYGFLWVIWVFYIYVIYITPKKLINKTK